MKRKRIKFDTKGLTKKFQNLASTMEKQIVEAMNLKGVKAISFIHNGDHSEYSVDVSWVYTYEECDYTTINENRIEILMVENNQLFVATSDTINDKDLEFLESADVFSPSTWDNANVDSEEFYVVNNALFSICTLEYLFHSVKEVLMECMKGKYLTNGETMCFSQLPLV